MKFLLLFAFLFVGEACYEHRLTCIKELNITGKTLRHVLSFDLDNPQTPACFLHCVVVKSGQYEDGVGYLVDNVIDTLKKMEYMSEEFNVEPVRNAFLACVEQFRNETEKCVKTVKVFRCFKNKGEEADVFTMWSDEMHMG